MVDLARNMVYNMNAELLTECARTAARLEAEKGAPKEKERQRRKQDREEQEKKWEAQRRNRGLEQAEQARLEVPEDRDPGTDDLLVEMVVQRRDMGEHEDGEPERPEGEAEAEQPADIEKDGQEGDALVADGPRAMNTEDVESNRQLSEPEAMEIEGEPAATQFFNADEVIAEDGANEQREDLANGNGDDVGMETERGQGDGEGVGTAGAARAEQPIDVDDGENPIAKFWGFSNPFLSLFC